MPETTIYCLSPDCVVSVTGEREAAKREIINHINNDHSGHDAVIACEHENTGHKKVDTELVLKQTNDYGREGQTIILHNIESACVRCGNRTNESDDPAWSLKA
jgi:hypothetical protein